MKKTDVLLKFFDLSWKQIEMLCEIFRLASPTTQALHKWPLCDSYREVTNLQGFISLEEINLLGLPRNTNFISVRNLYYILNKEIQEFLVSVKMLFLRSLEIFISSREINLCRLDTFPTMVPNRPVMFNRVPAFGLLWILLCMQLQLYTRLK